MSEQARDPTGWPSGPRGLDLPADPVRHGQEPVPPPAPPPAEAAPEGVELDGPGRQALDWLYRFVTAIELAPAVAVHSRDSAGIVRFWNHACAQLFGIPASHALGKPFRELVSHLDQQLEFDNTIAAIWRDGVAPAPRDWRVETAAGIIAAGDAVHVGFTFDGGTATLYLNGDLVGSTVFAGDWRDDPDPLVLGALADQSSRGAAENLRAFFDGGIDEVSLFDRVLGATEMERIHQAGEHDLL